MVKILSRGRVLENPAKILLKDLEIKEFKDRINNNFFHFQASYSSADFLGFGSSQSRSTAISKAVSEWVERYLFKFYKDELLALTSTGFAVHPDKDSALESAICERIERDAVISHWLSMRSPMWLSKSQLPSLIHNLIDEIEVFKFKIRFGILCVTNGRYCVLGYIDAGVLDPNLGYVFSSSCNKSLEGGLLSVYTELRRATTAILNREASKMEVINHDRINARYHFEYYLNRKNCFDIQWMFESSAKFPHYEVSISNLSLNLPFTFEWPLYGYFSYSKELQDFYFGNPRFRDINRARIKKVNANRKPLNRKLHILP